MALDCYGYLPPTPQPKVEKKEVAVKQKSEVLKRTPVAHEVSITEHLAVRDQ